jgi:hypothetical protein
MITLEVGEQIIYTSRRHWYAFFAEVAGIVLSAFVPLIGWALIAQTTFADIPNFGDLYLFLSAGWLLFVWMLGFIVWTNYYLDVLMVTNMRIIDIEQYHLFRYDVAEVRFERIQDIKVEVNGFLASLLNFGNITIQTSGSSKEFVIKMVHNPNEVKDIISRQQNKTPLR